MQSQNNIANLRLWEALGRTDPSQTKPFKRAGGFSGTAVKPMWSFKRMTEQFGPCGLGWGSDKPTFETALAGEEMMVFCTVGLWYVEGDKRGQVYGVGGDKFYIRSVKEINGKDVVSFRSSDEAFKAAYTEAIGNAMKLIGVAADVHMGLFDDSKYVREMAAEFAGQGHPEKPQLQHQQPSPQQPQPPANQRGRFTKVTEKQAIRFYAIAKGNGKSKSDVEYYLRNVAGVESGRGEDIAPERYEAACTWASTEYPPPPYRQDPSEITDDDIPF